MAAISTLPHVRITYADSWRVRALAREGRMLFKVVYDGTWKCECDQTDCLHVEAVKSVTRTI